MTKLTLRKLEISNFRGIKHKVIEFGDKVNLIKGQNGSGKSSVGSCLSWILSDTDIELNKNPLVTPIGASECETRVEAEIEINDKPVTIAKIQKYKSKTDDDGRLTSSITNSYEINSILKNQKDFMADIEERGLNIAEFMVLTNPNQFTADTSKKGRELMREILFKMASDFSDLDMAKEIEADEVITLLEKGYKLDEIEASAKSKIKKVNEVNGKSNEIIDGRIQGILDSKVDTDINSLKAKEKALNDELAALNSELEDIKANNSDTKIKELEYRKKDIEDQITHEFYTETQKYEVLIAHKKGEIEKLDLEAKAKSEKCKELRASIKSAEETLENYRTLYKKVQDETLDENDFKCPTCQTPYGPEKAEIIKSQFEESKNERLNSYKTKGEEIKAKIEELKDQHERSCLSERQKSDYASELRKEINEIDDKIADLGEEPDFRTSEEWAEICKELDGLQAKSDVDNEELLVALSDKKAKLANELQVIYGDLAVAERNQELDKQIVELREAKREGEISKAKNEKILSQVSDVKAHKDDKLAGSINAKFTMVEWHFWEIQRNGDRKDIAEPYVDGKPMSTCANGSLRTLAKVSICSDIQRHMDVSYPIFIDDYTLFSNNSIERLRIRNSQLIGLVVSEDKEVTIERGE